MNFKNNKKLRKYFSLTDRERAVFELGIKLGGIYHQYVGIPVNKNNISLLEKTIESAVSLQPYVKSVRVRINKKGMGKKKYLTLTGDMLNVRVTVEYNGEGVEGVLRYIREIDYPLMFVPPTKKI